MNQSNQFSQIYIDEILKDVEDMNQSLFKTDTNTIPNTFGRLLASQQG